MTKTSVGYTAGHDKSPTYNSVCSGNTGHTEAVQVTTPIVLLLEAADCCSVTASSRQHIIMPSQQNHEVLLLC